MEPDFNAPTRIGIAVVWHEGNVLVGRRPPGKPLAEYWEFPGGKMESGESPADAAQRECWEETGVRVTPEKLYLTENFVYDHGQVELHFFRCRVTEIPGNHPTNPTPPYRWVALADLRNFSFPAANQRLLSLLTTPPT